MKPNAIEEHLKTLSLHRISEIYNEEAENAAKANSRIPPSEKVGRI